MSNMTVCENIKMTKSGTTILQFHPKSHRSQDPPPKEAYSTPRKQDLSNIFGNLDIQVSFFGFS